MRTKYQLRPQNLNGTITNFDWITDLEIENLLRMTDGTPITLIEAAHLYYQAAIREDLTVDHAVVEMGIVKFAISKSYRINILLDLVAPLRQ